MSKFGAVPYKTSGSDSKRGLRFSKEIVDKIGLQYKNEDEIKIIRENNRDAEAGDKFASDASDASLFKSVYPISASEPMPEQSITNPVDLSCKSDNLAEVADSTVSNTLLRYYN